MSAPASLGSVRLYRLSSASSWVREEPQHAPQKPKLIDRVRRQIRTRHYSLRTEKSYVGWIRRFIIFHGERHPAEMGAAEISTFLGHLAVQGRVSASTQNQALSALLFLYRDVLDLDTTFERFKN